MLGVLSWPAAYRILKALPLSLFLYSRCPFRLLFTAPATAAAWSGWSPLEAAHSAPAGAAPGTESDEQLARRLQARIAAGCVSAHLQCRDLRASVTCSLISAAVVSLPGPDCCIHLMSLLCLLPTGGVRC